MWGLLCCLCSCSCWSPDQIDAPKTGQIARKHGSRTDKLTNRGAAGAGALCWGGRAEDPNKLKATKINYENFHFTFEFLVTCNFVKLMRLFGVPNLIMKMSLCKFLCLFLFLCALLCLFRHCYTVSQSQWNEFQLSKVIIMNILIWIFRYSYTFMNTLAAFVLKVSFNLLQLARFNSPCQLDQSAHTHKEHTHTSDLAYVRYTALHDNWLSSSCCLQLSCEKKTICC